MMRMGKIFSNFENDDHDHDHDHDHDQVTHERCVHGDLDLLHLLPKKPGNICA